MNFLLSILAVIAAFALPILLTSRHRRRASFGLAVLTFIVIQVATMESSEKKLSVSDVGYATVEVEGEKTLYVKHPEGEFQTSKATLVNNIDDTTQVEIVLKKTESVWFGPSAYLKVRSKR